MSDRKSAPRTPFNPPQHTPELLLDMIRSVLEGAEAPERAPHKPCSYMNARQLEQAPHDCEDALATRRWQLHATDVAFRNRRRVQALLWACRTLRDSFGGKPEFAELGTPLFHRLIAFGWHVDVPDTHSEIMHAARTWVPAVQEVWAKA